MAFLRRRRKRALLIGLDCASPQLIFETFRDDLPTLRRLMTGGTWGTLESSTPCITVPAWSSMMTSRDAGELGIYGFRNRAGWDYDALITADSSAVPYPRLWEILGAQGKQSLIVNVPQTYPVKPLQGALVSCFLTPNTSASFSYPAILKAEILKHTPNYDFDVRDFRTSDKAGLYQRLLDLTALQYETFNRLLQSQSWDFAMHVNMGTDRLHHGFWRYHDPQHRLHEPNSPFKHAIRDYYKLVDEHIARLLQSVDDDTLIGVVSDHGVLRMDGAIAINDWLWKNGWLSLKQAPPTGEILKFNSQNIDWSGTRAWSTGGYYGRIFLNVQGREPQGIVPPQDYERTLTELSAHLQSITGDQGQALQHQLLRPAQIYRQVRGYAPDLMVYFGDLHWRAVGGFGYAHHTTLENDTGPDDANHSPQGMFLWHHPHQRGKGKLEGARLLDISPTLLHYFGIAPSPEMQGHNLL